MKKSVTSHPMRATVATRHSSLSYMVLVTMLGLALLPSCRPAEEPTLSPTAKQPPLERFTFREPHLGTHAGLVFYAPNKTVANRSATAVYDRIRELDAVFSTYRDDSELQRLCRNPKSSQGVAISADLGNVLELAQQISRQSEGAFDITVGPAARVWKRAIRRKQAPDETALQNAMQSVGHAFLRLERISKPSASSTEFRVTLLRPNMQIDLAAIAKGYIADAALATLAEHGCKSALVDLGGDLAIGDPPPDKAGWRVAMASGKMPVRNGNDVKNQGQTPEVITLHNCGLATSGDAFQHVEIGGKRYSHIVDARTGQATTESLTVTVISPTSVMADALASAVSVLGAQRGRDFIQEIPNCEASILPGENDSTNPAVRLTTNGFPPCEIPTTSAIIPEVAD